MKKLWSSFKTGAVVGAGTFGATFMTLLGIILVSIAIMAYYSMVATRYVCGCSDDKPSPFELTLSSVCDTYLFWYENITTAIKNLVK